MGVGERSKKMNQALHSFTVSSRISFLVLQFMRGGFWRSRSQRHLGLVSNFGAEAHLSSSEKPLSIGDLEKNFSVVLFSIGNLCRRQVSARREDR